MANSTRSDELEQKRVAIYLRISTDERNQPWSLSAQRERCEAFCRAQDELLVSTFVDEATGTTLERPELQKALAEARKGTFDVLLFYRIDRLSRNLAQLLEIADELEKAGGSLASVTEPLDTSTPVGRMIMQVLGAIAELEREMIVDRIREGVERRIRSGKSLFRSLPMGMKLGRDGLPCVDPEWFPLALRIFEMYGEEQSAGVDGDCSDAQRGRPSHQTGKRWDGQGRARNPSQRRLCRNGRNKGELIPANFEPILEKRNSGTGRRRFWTNAGSTSPSAAGTCPTISFLAFLVASSAVRHTSEPPATEGRALPVLLLPGPRSAGEGVL